MAKQHNTGQSSCKLKEQRQERCSFVVNMITGKQAHTSLHGRKDHSSLCQTMAKRATLDRLAATKKEQAAPLFCR